MITGEPAISVSGQGENCPALKTQKNDNDTAIPRRIINAIFDECKQHFK